MKLIKQLFCKHEWEGRGFSWARCLKCDKQKYSPKIARETINKHCDSMVGAGHWEQSDIMKEKIKRGFL